MFSFKVFYLLIVINLFGLSFVKLDESNEVKHLNQDDKISMERKVKNWVPLENSEIMKVYFYNVTNLNEYINNEDGKIRVEELQPFVYSTGLETPSLLGIVPNQSIAIYELNHNHTFDESMKDFNQKRAITTIDTKIVDLLDDKNKYLNVIISAFNMSAKEATELPFESKLLSDLKMSENTFNVPSIYGLDTGKQNPTFEGKVGSVNGRYGSKCYSNQVCPKNYQEVQSVHMQFLRNKLVLPKDQTKLEVLISDRAVPFVFKNNYLYKGLNVSRYEQDESAMSMKSEANKCLCDDKNKKVDGVSLCDMDGILDYKKCALVAKVYSNPHLLDASTVLQNHVEGLKPDATKHRSYVDVDPATGVILNYRLSVQLNAFIRISELGYKKGDILVPYYWVESTTERTDAFMENYKQKRLAFI